MATNPFTLAALATTAVPGIQLRAAVDDGSDAETERVAAQTADGRTVRISVPRAPHVLERAQAEAKALSAATEGVRERLPFEVAELLGRAPLGKTEIFVWTRLGGAQARLDDIGDGEMPTSIAAAIAAIHDLPTSIVADASLPHRSAPRIREGVLEVFDRAVATRRVPTALLHRWEQAAENAEQWQFTPAVIHGDLQAPALRTSAGSVCGVEGWHALSVGDPARDLAWLLGSADFAAVDHAFEVYASRRPGDRFLRTRAMLHAELDIARWLLFGVERDDEATIADAVSMLEALVDRVDDEDDTVRLEPKRLETMDLSDVQQLLEGNVSLGVARSRAAHAVGGASAAQSSAEVETVPVDGLAADSGGGDEDADGDAGDADPQQ